MGMNQSHGTIAGLLVFLSGLALVAGQMNWVDESTAMLVAGLTLAIFGLMKMVHAMKMCDSCASCCGPMTMPPAKKKRK